ncbi:MAG TPA: helicase-related protein, partial [Hyphomicrobium sp.]|nr:helicase-related protein [Hyphomicrobium sp.]
FSATMPNEIAGLANELLKEPVKVAVTPVSTTAERVSQRVILIETTKKRALLAELLGASNMGRTLVFTRTKRGADRVARHLEGGGTKVAAIHGNKSQRQREMALEDFKHGRINVLVATDIAARGIDVDLVTHVVNYELPEVPEAYVHRIGRTARAGASGTAISLCDAAERDLLRGIERVTRQTIPHEDRRNDPNIVADKTPSHRNDGQPTNGARRGAPHRQNGSAHNAGGRRRNERPAERAGERKDTHREARDGASRTGAPGQRSAPNGHRTHKPREDRGRGEADQGGGLRNVGFLTRSTRSGDARPRKQGFGPRPNRDARPSRDAG